MSDSVADRLRAAEQRRRDSLAHQLHAVIRHKSPPKGVEPGELLERAICVVGELARATRITARVWSDALHTIRQPDHRT